MANSVVVIIAITMAMMVMAKTNSIKLNNIENQDQDHQESLILNDHQHHRRIPLEEQLNGNFETLDDYVDSSPSSLTTENVNQNSTESSNSLICGDVQCGANTYCSNDPDQTLTKRSSRHHRFQSSSLPLLSSSSPQCACLLGYYRVTNFAQDCELLPCENDLQCSMIFGANTSCLPMMKNNDTTAINGSTNESVVDDQQQQQNFGICGCDGHQYHLNPITQQCVFTKVVNPTGDDGPKCSNNNQCTESNSFCNIQTGQCQCRFAYRRIQHVSITTTTTNDDDSTDSSFTTSATTNTTTTACVAENCQNDRQCRALFGAHTYCDRISSYGMGEGLCKCEQSYHIDEATQKCVTNARSLGQTCHADMECGANALCATVEPIFIWGSGGGSSILSSMNAPWPLIAAAIHERRQRQQQQQQYRQCQCEINYRPKLTTTFNDDEDSAVNCVRYTCESDTDCVMQNGVNLQCNIPDGECVCDWAAGFEFNHTTQQCLARSLMIGQQCDPTTVAAVATPTQSSVNCGIGAYCSADTQTCQCKFGYTQQGGINNQMDCTPIQCLSNTDCPLVAALVDDADNFWDNGKCIDSTCSCPDNSYLQVSTQKCITNDGDGDGDGVYTTSPYYAPMVLYIGTLSLMVILLSVCVIARKHQYLEQQQRQQRLHGRGMIVRNGSGGHQRQASIAPPPPYTMSTRSSSSTIIPPTIYEEK